MIEEPLIFLEQPGFLLPRCAIKEHNCFFHRRKLNINNAAPVRLWVKDKVLPQTDHPNAARLTFVLLGLAFSVFAWGLQYKLSLYDAPHSTSHLMPEAKLLSRNEQTTAAESPLLTSTTASDAIEHALLCNVFTFLLSAFALLPMPSSSHAEREMKRPWRIFCRPGLTAFFFRPPPILG
jgi:hypothetical protein